MNKSLSIIEVLALAEKIAVGLGLAIQNKDELADSLVSIQALPQIYKNGIVSLWVDRHYIAYSYEDSENIEYVYVAKNHIEEERESYAVASRHRCYCIELPVQIDEQFTIAQNEMLKTNKKYHIFQEYSKS